MRKASFDYEGTTVWWAECEPDRWIEVAGEPQPGDEAEILASYRWTDETTGMIHGVISVNMRYLRDYGTRDVDVSEIGG